MGGQGAIRGLLTWPPLQTFRCIDTMDHQFGVGGSYNVNLTSPRGWGYRVYTCRTVIKFVIEWCCCVLGVQGGTQPWDNPVLLPPTPTTPVLPTLPFLAVGLQTQMLSGASK